MDHGRWCTSDGISRIIFAVASDVFEKLFSAHVIAAMAKQQHVGSIIGDSAWEIDIGQGRLFFAHASFRVEVLGTQSDGDRSWLWGWANAASELPDHVLSRTRTLPTVAGGSIPELTERSFPQAVADGYHLSVVAGGLLGADGYYRCPYDGGQLFVLLFDDQLTLSTPHSIRQFMSALMTVHENFTMADHQLAIQAYARTAGLEFHQQPNSTARIVGADGTATFTFSEAGRMKNTKVDYNKR